MVVTGGGRVGGGRVGGVTGGLVAGVTGGRVGALKSGPAKCSYYVEHFHKYDLHFFHNLNLLQDI